MGQSVSKIEHERQQILEEMKKRTQLLTDNSWIRQRSSSFYKEPICVGVPLKRWVCLHQEELCCTFRQFCFTTFLIKTSPPRLFLLPSYYCVFSAGTSLWTTWMLCVSPRTPPLRSITLVHTQPLQVTALRAGTPPPATAREQYHPREMRPWTLIVAGMRLTHPVSLLHVVVCLFSVLSLRFGLTLSTCAAPGWSVAGGLAVCVSVPWVAGQP